MTVRSWNRVGRKRGQDIHPRQRLLELITGKTESDDMLSGGLAAKRQDDRRGSAGGNRLGFTRRQGDAVRCDGWFLGGLRRP